MRSRRERRSGARWRAAWITGATALVAASPGSGAQISPGPLSRAHSELEGVLNCLKCHGIGESTLDARCLDCHREIEWLRARSRGLHGTEDLGECASCHQEHGGERFEIVRWGDPGGFAAFDHRRAGWELEGRHANVECRTCHRAELRVSPVTQLGDGGLSANTWLGLETGCASCHRDPHEGRLGTDCAECHTARDFHEILEGRFDHERTSYPLRGAHRSASCRACHQGGEGWNQRPAFASCADCHADPHGGRATIAGRRAECAECHVVKAFRPSTFTVAMHADAAFPLAGKHRRVTCAACHPAAEGTVALRLPHGRCSDCHPDPHGDQLAARPDGGACESCHRVEGFSPSTFSIEDHAALRFPLAGRHAETECRSCHGPGQSLPGDPAGVSGRAGVFFRFEDSACRSCHADPHEGKFAADGCAACHDQKHFSPSSVDAARHASFEFPLRGAHAAIPCLECHRELERKPGARRSPLRFEIERRECRDCHRDPHGGQFDERAGGGACSGCHDESSFAPATRFDHARDADFPLQGAHERTACAACHPTTELAGGRSVRYRPVPRRCEDCHAGVTP